MPLLPAYYTTTNTRKRKSKKVDDSEHQKWLEKQGLTRSQIRAKKSKSDSWKREYAEALKVERSTKEHDSRSVIASPASAAANRSIMANLHKEPKHVQEAILAKAKRVMPLYNKGGLQLLTDSDDLKSLNKTVRV